MNKDPLFDYASQRSKIKDPANADKIEPALKNNSKQENLRLKTEEWISQNPSVYQMFKEFTRQMMSAGMKFNISLLMERVRWECHFRFNGQFKVNNDYKPYISRKLAEDIPELRGVLKFRSTRW